MKSNTPSQATEFQKRVWKITRSIPKGRISTYKEVAFALGTNAFRAVGNALRCNPDAPATPCHRVVASDGSLGGYNGEMNSGKKVELLRSEGVRVIEGRVVDFATKYYSFKARLH